MVDKEPEIPVPTPTPKRSIKKKRVFTPEPHSPRPSADVDRAKTSIRKRKKLTSNVPEKARLCNLRRAEEVKSSLDPQFPSFVRYMVRSHVSCCFWLGLPASFCKLHLPKQDELMTLVDESGEEYQIKFIIQNPALSGGWRRFSIEHKLVEGDALVFQLIEATKFKVFIVRISDLPNDDRAPDHLEKDACPKEDPVEEKNAGLIIKLSRKPLQNHKIEEHNGGEDMKTPRKPGLKRQKMKNQTSLDLGMPIRQTGTEVVDAEALHGIWSSGSCTEFKDVTDIESFAIKVNGLVIDSEISEHIRVKYYDLCCSQSDFLHEHLECSNSKLVAGIISETVNIADAIKGSKLGTSRNEFAAWGKTLMAFEHMGMKVGFLRSRLQRLVSLAFESELAKTSKRYKDALKEKSCAEEEIKSIEAKLVELKETLKKLEPETESLKVEADIHEVKFEEAAIAPW